MSSSPEEIREEGKGKKARRRLDPKPPADPFAAFNALLSHPRLQPEFRPRETPADADFRRKKKFLSFLVKDLSPDAVAILFILAAGVYRLYVLLNSKASPEAQQRAWSVFTTLLTGIVGFIFGKAAGR